MQKSQLFMIVSVLLLGTLYFLPLWNITLEAPQYPTPIGMNIYINKISDANPNDLKNINLMNHYIGMKEIPEHMEEFDIFPIVIASMMVLGLIFAFFGIPRLYILWFVMMACLGIIGMYDFYLWEYDYGHNLSAKAAIKFTDELGQPMAYQPPLFGAKTILNFRALSYPRLGAFALMLSMGFSLVAFYFRKKEQ